MIRPMVNIVISNSIGAQRRTPRCGELATFYEVYKKALIRCAPRNERLKNLISFIHFFPIDISY